MLNSAESPIEVAPVDFIEMGGDTNSRVDQAAVERSWRERGFSCGLWVDPPGQVWADYVHDTDELRQRHGISRPFCSARRPVSQSPGKGT